MKKIIFSMVGSMLIGLCSLQAQDKNDETGTTRNKQQDERYEKSRQKSDRTRYQSEDKKWEQQSDRSNRGDGANEGMVQVDKSEIPATLKQTLKDEKYAGWENATIYHNTNTGEYVIAPRAYRFDKQGKEMEMDNTAYGNRRGRYSSGDLNTADPARTRESETRQRPDAESAQGRSQDEMNQSSSSQDRATQSTSSQDQASQRDQTQSQQSANRDQARQNDQQQPSSSYRTNPDRSSDATRSQAPGQRSQTQYRTEDMTEIQAEQVPSSLRQTLKGNQYSGWEESGTLYQDPSSNEYVLEMEKGDASQPRYYRFDKNGQAKSDPNPSGNNDQ